MAKPSKRRYVPLTDMTSVQQGKQVVLENDSEGNDIRLGYVLKIDGKWRGYVLGRPDLRGTGTSRDKAFADAVHKLQTEEDVAQGKDA